jgi:hypothetical protein
MQEQSYAKHAKIVPMFHGMLFGLILVALIGALVNLFRHIGDEHERLTAVLVAIIALALPLFFLFTRTFPIKVQDRAIRAEENLRHYVLTGKLLDPRLTVKQIVGLRFASDEEFPALAKRAAEEKLSLDVIKKSVKQWRPDYDRA